jgi:hypothetical protein
MVLLGLVCHKVFVDVDRPVRIVRRDDIADLRAELLDLAIHRLEQFGMTPNVVFKVVDHRRSQDSKMLRHSSNRNIIPLIPMKSQTRGPEMMNNASFLA